MDIFEWSENIPVTANNLNEMQNIINNNISEEVLDVYSTSEQIIGTWIDGRPVYRVTVETTTPSTSGSWKEIYTGHNVNNITKYGGYYVRSSLKFAIPLNTNDRNFWFSVNSSNNIQMAVDSSSDVGKNITVWFEYIKNN